MHHLTRSTIAASTLILAIGAAVALANSPLPAPPAASVPREVQPPAPRVPDPPHLTQRSGEWSPICAATGEPLVDFSPVDLGSGRHRVLITAHNCSATPVELTEPVVWFGGREAMAEPFRPDRDRSEVTPLTLPAWESAALVLTWESGAIRTPEDRGGVLSIRVPGVGEGELQDTALGIGHTSRGWLSGWQR